MKILGLDLADRVGICVLSAGERGTPREVEIIWSDSLVLGRRDPEKRLLALRDLIAGTITRFKPSEMAIEDLFLPEKTSRKTPISLGELRGVARLCAADANLEVHFYPPARVKLAVTGSGRASKEDVIRFIEAEFQISLKDDNEADAVSIAYTHWLVKRFSQAVTQGSPSK